MPEPRRFAGNHRGGQGTGLCHPQAVWYAASGCMARTLNGFVYTPDSRRIGFATSHSPQTGKTVRNLLRSAAACTSVLARASESSATPTPGAPVRMSAMRMKCWIYRSSSQRMMTVRSAFTTRLPPATPAQRPAACGTAAIHAAVASQPVNWLIQHVFPAIIMLSL